MSILTYRSPPGFACWSGDQQGRFIPHDTIAVEIKQLIFGDERCEQL